MWNKGFIVKTPAEIPWELKEKLQTWHYIQHRQHFYQQSSNPARLQWKLDVQLEKQKNYNRQASMCKKVLIAL